jgi:hypothetical protein
VESVGPFVGFGGRDAGSAVRQSMGHLPLQDESVGFGNAGCANPCGQLLGELAPLILMEVRCLWPHNMIGHLDPIVQRLRSWVLADEPSVICMSLYLI